MVGLMVAITTIQKQQNLCLHAVMLVICIVPMRKSGISGQQIIVIGILSHGHSQSVTLSVYLNQQHL